MEQFKPNQPDSIPTRKLIGFFIPWVMALVFLILLIGDYNDFFEPWGFWACFVVLLAVLVIIPVFVARMQRDYKNGRNR